MKFTFLKRRKFWVRFILLLFIVPIFLFTLLIAVLYWKQDQIVKELIYTLNEDFEGHFELRESHISPFENFPYISIDLEGLVLYEDGSKEGIPILNIDDAYISFNLWDVASGNLEIQSILLENGSINLVQHIDGSFNVTNALATKKDIEDPSEEFHLDLKSIELFDIDIKKFNESTGMIYDVFVNEAKSNFKTSGDDVQMFLDSKFILTCIDNGDTTFIHDKHFDVHGEIDYLAADEILKIIPSEIALEGSVFNMDGEIDFADDMNVNINFKGEKPNFDLFMALAPDELNPTLKKYDNQGQVYFKGLIQGKSINGHTPFIDAEFGCSEALFTNNTNNKKIDDLRFKGHFTNGKNRDASTMEFSLVDFSAKPEAGEFSGDLLVTNFDEPEINLKLVSNFQLAFLANFFDLEGLEDLSGGIELTMNFHDIIDLTHPEKSIEKLNESYYTELKITDLSFAISGFHLPVKDMDLYAVMDGHEAHIDYFDLLLGSSDLHIQGTIDDLPAIIHHTSKDVTTHLDVTSKYLDLLELTSAKGDTTEGIDETITNLSLGLSFKNSAKDFTESPNLPIGEFFIDNFYAQLKHYPHTLHDFHADIIIDESDMKIVDFTGMIDKSDFHFGGGLSHYDLWFAEHPKGDTKIEFNLKSDMLQLEDLFAYGGENYVPEDYRHEEFDDLNIHGFADLHYNDGLQSTDVTIDKFESKMKVHHLRFEDFGGSVHIQNEHLIIDNFKGTLGRSKFVLNTDFYLGDDPTRSTINNSLSLAASRLDFDELFAYEPSGTEFVDSPKEHDSVFNIYDIPFPDLKVNLDIDNLNYHLYKIKDFHGKFRVQSNHYLYVDTLTMHAANGDIALSGYFNGSDPGLIYFSPKMKFHKVDLDKLMVKFENFGQDHLVSENLHGTLSGDLWGKIHMHADMVPIIDDSEIHIDFSVTSGKLENYGPMEYLSDYFADKNLAKVIFDTLQNHIDLNKGTLTIPNMTINTSLGFVEMSGQQNLDYSYEYFIRVPWKMVSKVGASKLFGKKKGEEVDPNQEDEIEYLDESKKVRYVNIQILGDLETYSIKLKKDKKNKKG
jgi:hypothetical protein